MSVREIHNSMVSPPEEGILKETIYVDNNITISDYTLQSIILPQLKKIYSRYKVICGCECCISDKSIHSSLLSWCDFYLRRIIKVYQGDFLGTLALARAPRAQAKKIEKRNLEFSQGTYRTTAQRTIRMI